MFFNDDILFRNGRLALVWRAGNGHFNTDRGRKRKEFRAILNTSVISICADIRKLFPKMGTAHGIGLKKMGTLVKGVGAIYSMKINNLAKDVLETTTKLKRPAPSKDARIDAAMESKSKGSKTVPPPEPSVVDDEFGRLPIAVNAGTFENGDVIGRFGLLIDSEDFIGPPRGMPARISDYPTSTSMVIPSPARSVNNEGEGREERPRRKRRLDEEDNEEAVHEDVIHRLQRYVDVNADRLHCLPEDDQPLIPLVDDQQLDLDFGGEQAMFDLLNMGENHVEAGSMEPQEQPQSPLQFDTRSKILETPRGAGTRPENAEGRRLIRERDPDITLDELSPQGERARGRARPRRRILVDADISIPPKQMLDRITAIRAETTMSLLQQRLLETRAPGKSVWKTMTRSIQFITKAGRRINGVALQGLRDEMLNAGINGPERLDFGQQRERANVHPVSGRPEASIEDERERNATTDIGISAGSTGLHGERTDAEIAPASPQVQADCIPAGGDAGGMEDGMFQHMDVQFSPRPQEYEPNPFVEPEPAPSRRKRRRESGVEDLPQRMELRGRSTFLELFSPNECSRKEAAFGFFLLLKMQARKEVIMRQDEPYGPILIENLNLRSQ
ncbi:Sister chromatid cohesion 1 protein 4 [Orchesella cincta]|uniref:Sister chromatid cohesion 1 protein 4 n=1 Tax=Orchesella cincta TaxID=48709 RepID=A0A1D2MT97_ORCCI|nr:Sister chromatid cohesion 1 protein 4 [Orchesella cincta]